MMRSSALPMLPGFPKEVKVGQTHFPRTNNFNRVEGVMMVSEPVEGRSESTVYARGDTLLPTWLAYDKMTLAFDAYLKEKMPEFKGYNFIVRKCKLYFFMEDSTIKVVEKKNVKSPFPQIGCIIGRQKIPFPATGNRNDYYDIIDLNVGKSVELLGRVFHITDCDVFTRTFLNRLGIPVPDPSPTPDDPFEVIKTQEEEARKRKIRADKKMKTLDEFLTMDSRMLTFDAFWDDRNTMYGYLHLLKLYYYIADDTIEIKDVTEKEKNVIIVKRIKLPKEMTEEAFFGADAGNDLLNVVGTNDGRVLSKIDPLSFGRFQREYYTDKDLAIGAVIIAYGKRVVIYDCDPFTKEFYRVKFGLDDFTPLQRPLTKEEEEAIATKNISTDLPPYNGFGTYEDSALNCKSIAPQNIVKNYRRFYEKDKKGYDSRVLRFSAKLMSTRAEDEKRNFVVCFYVVDDTVSVYEGCKNFVVGLSCSMMSRRRMFKPNQEYFTSKTPDYYRQDSFYIGNVLTLESHTFLLTGADEYALKYMELHSNEFPVSNVNLILDKVRDKVQHKYKEFAAQFFQENELKPMSYFTFRNSLKDIFGENMTEHEIVTLARAFKCHHQEEKYSLETLRRLTHDELKRHLWDDSVRMREGFLARDPDRRGAVDKATAYAVLRGAKLPLDVNMINLLMTKFSRDEDCTINYDQLLSFMDYKKFPASPVTPINIPANMSWLNLHKPDTTTEINYVNVSLFLDSLNLEEELKQQTQGT